MAHNAMHMLRKDTAVMSQWKIDYHLGLWSNIFLVNSVHLYFF